MRLSLSTRNRSRARSAGVRSTASSVSSKASPKPIEAYSRRAQAAVAGGEACRRGQLAKIAASLRRPDPTAA